MTMLERFSEAEAFNLSHSQQGLERFHGGAIETMETGADLFEIFAQEFADHCDLPNAESDVNAWLSSVGSGAHQLVEFLEQASLVGSPGADDLARKAQDGLMTAKADLVRTWLLMRLHRDYVFGLGDLLRLRLTPAIGYLRLQSETVGLLALFTAEQQLAVDWIDLAKGGGDNFYRRTQGKLKGKLKALQLVNYYDEGSEWALHSRVFGIAGGVAKAPVQRPNQVGLSYQELGGDTDELFTWVWHYLNAHRLFAGALIDELPELQQTETAVNALKSFATRLATWSERKRRFARLKGR